MDSAFKKPKKTAVQLTSLLDLLFVMIFVSMLQQKNVSPPAPTKPLAKAKTEATPTPKKRVITANATFHFYGTSSNPNIPSGKYLMQGQYDTKDGRLRMGGIGWLERPKHYDMVPLSGVIDSAAGSFTGRIESIGCKTFTLSRKVKANGSPIAGEWIGSYDCSQGATGLTLSIK